MPHPSASPAQEITAIRAMKIGEYHRRKALEQPQRLATEIAKCPTLTPTEDADTGCGT